MLMLINALRRQIIRARNATQNMEANEFTMQLHNELRCRN